MPLLWVAYSSIRQYSIGWRIGSGKYYKYDKILGIGMAASNENAANPLKWQVSSLLGFALTEVKRRT